MTQVIDFETITTNEVQYFLYRNESASATDVNSENNWYIVPDVDFACQYDGYQLMKNLDRLTSVRNTIDSYFMVISESYILILMFILAILAVWVIPEMLKEHHIPMLFR